MLIDTIIPITLCEIFPKVGPVLVQNISTWKTLCECIEVNIYFVENAFYGIQIIGKDNTDERYLIPKENRSDFIFVLNAVALWSLDPQVRFHITLVNSPLFSIEESGNEDENNVKVAEVAKLFHECYAEPINMLIYLHRISEGKFTKIYKTPSSPSSPPPSSQHSHFSIPCKKSCGCIFNSSDILIQTGSECSGVDTELYPCEYSSHLPMKDCWCCEKPDIKHALVCGCIVYNNKIYIKDERCKFFRHIYSHIAECWYLVSEDDNLSTTSNLLSRSTFKAPCGCLFDDEHCRVLLNKANWCHGKNVPRRCGITPHLSYTECKCPKINRWLNCGCTVFIGCRTETSGVEKRRVGCPYTHKRNGDEWILYNKDERNCGVSPLFNQDPLLHISPTSPSTSSSASLPSTTSQSTLPSTSQSLPSTSRLPVATIPMYVIGYLCCGCIVFSDNSVTVGSYGFCDKFSHVKLQHHDRAWSVTMTKKTDQNGVVQQNTYTEISILFSVRPTFDQVSKKFNVAISLPNTTIPQQKLRYLCCGCTVTKDGVMSKYNTDCDNTHSHTAGWNWKVDITSAGGKQFRITDKATKKMGDYTRLKVYKTAE